MVVTASNGSTRDSGTCYVTRAKMSKRKNVNNIATSEVGSNDPPIDLQQMFRGFAEVMRSMMNSHTVQKAIVLPKFNAESPEADASSWCSMVELIFGEEPLEGTKLIAALSGALVAEASQWLLQICFPGITWQQFKELFLQRSGKLETSAASVLNWLNSKPKVDETISAYGGRLVNALETKWKEMSAEQIAVSVALAHMSRVDPRLQRMVCTTEIRNRSELQHELQAFSFVEKKSTTEIVPPKRLKFSSIITCHFCGKEGHKIAECRQRKEQQKHREQHSSSQATFNKDRKSITCYKCGEVGHIASRCSKPGGSGVQPKRVDVCSLVGEPQGTLIHAGESFPFYFDTGAECSLIRESMASKFHGKRVNNLIMLKGLSDDLQSSTLQILAIVAVNEIVLEVLFHVVLDKMLKYDIVIGREVLDVDIGADVTVNKFTFYKKTEEVNFNIAQVSCVNFQELDLKLNEPDRSKLVSILQNYSDSLILGIPHKRVTTGQLQIRVVDNNKTVQRRPYRMSSEEREIE